MKRYGRAPTSLMCTRYEQVRSVVAATAGDWESARQTELVLPETGVCSLPAASKEADEAPAVAARCGAASERDLVTDAP